MVDLGSRSSDIANIVAKTFANAPEAATSSILMIALAVIFGYFVSKRVNLGIATVFGVIGVVACILLGIKFPLALFRKHLELLL